LAARPTGEGETFGAPQCPNAKERESLSPDVLFCECCAKLAEFWVLMIARREGRARLEESAHVYYIDDAPLYNSVTKMLGRYWPKFDGPAVAAKCFAGWQSDRFSKHYSLIRYLTLFEGLDAGGCQERIAQMWVKEGELASKAGTAMHLDLQRIVEGAEPPQGETREVTMFRAWLQEFCDKYGLVPWRAEWVVYFTAPSDLLDCSDGNEEDATSDSEQRSEGRPVVAGQIDLVLKHRERDEYWCVDYKRKDPSPKYKNGPAQLLGEPCGGAFNNACGSGPFAELPATDFAKYTAQLNAYGYIAATQYGIDFRDRMCLLQIHPDLSSAHLARVERLDEEMEKLFAEEAARGR
jgi:hypothetical protein